MSPLDSYLARVARELRFMPPSKRDNELRELRSHLEQRAQDFQHQGFNLEAAQQQATEEFGKPGALGARLTDAWEGIPFSWWRVASSCFIITLIWFFFVALVSVPMSFSGQFPLGALFPEFVPLVLAFYLSVPLLCGALFTQRLGRRGRLIGAIYFILLCAVFDANLHFIPPAPGQAPPSPIFANTINSAWNPLSTIILIFVGAHLFYAWDRRTRLRLAEAHGLAFTVRPTGWRRLPLGLRTWLRGMIFSAILIALAFVRISRVRHPSTPVEALRYSLIVNQAPGFEAPQFEQLEQLPPLTPAQRAGYECRVRFQLQVHAKPYFQANQLAQLNREVATDARSKYGADPSTTATIARVKSNSNAVSGIARLIRTSKGWQVDENSFDRSQLWAWFYEH